MSSEEVRPTHHGITFKATKKDIVVATNNRGHGSNLRDIMITCKVFQTAFPADDENDANEGGRRFRQRNPKPDPSAIIIQSSKANGVIRSAPWGLVSAVFDAYNSHYNLALRPDDVWQAILTQFSFYVNANAEALRDKFVDFKGKKTLVVTMPPGTIITTDFGTFANRMVDEQIAANLKDSEVTEWLIPSFSTTETSDRVAASVTIMSTLQAYFSYVCRTCCGIPEVTLKGTVDDWKLLRQKIDRLLAYDVEGKDALMAKWHGVLAPVLDQFVSSAEGNHDVDFWEKIVSYNPMMGSGAPYITGWITAFACFTAKGRWHGNGLLYTDSVPVGAVSVPVLFDDNGTQYDTKMLAGQFAYEMTADTAGGNLNAVRPRNDWCIAYKGEPKADPRPYRAGELREE